MVRCIGPYQFSKHVASISSCCFNGHPNCEGLLFPYLVELQPSRLDYNFHTLWIHYIHSVCCWWCSHILQGTSQYGCWSSWQLRDCYWWVVEVEKIDVVCTRGGIVEKCWHLTCVIAQGTKETQIILDSQIIYKTRIGSFIWLDVPGSITEWISLFVRCIENCFLHIVYGGRCATAEPC